MAETKTPSVPTDPQPTDPGPEPGTHVVDEGDGPRAPDPPAASPQGDGHPGEGYSYRQPDSTAEPRGEGSTVNILD